ncbi:hypothetical protein M3Y94_00847600 [Aphelenchoides besseyi]|nr:hypothetical protein M3Y94_00847600 [Aphelenchoides besseyi]KAI6226861.1 hypothetical protein M3Y95_00665700 [Aphelenchoides besseyi]
MSDVGKISDLLCTASFAFGHIADLCRELDDLERKPSPIVRGVDVRQRVSQFSNDLNSAPKMRISYGKPYLQRRPPVNRSSLVMDTGRSVYPKPQPDAYRTTPSTLSTIKTFSQLKPESNSSLVYRKRTAEETKSDAGMSKQVKGIKWVAASGDDVQKSALPATAPTSRTFGSKRSLAPETRSEFHQRDHNNNFNSNMTFTDEFSSTLSPWVVPTTDKQTNKPLLKPKLEFNESTMTESEFAVSTLLMNWNQRGDSESEPNF